MKKIVGIIFSVLVISGCNRESLQTKKGVTVKKTVITEAKEYYVGKVTYVNHDDYFVEEKDNNVSVLIKESTKKIDSVVILSQNAEIQEKNDSTKEDEIKKIRQEVVITEEVKDNIEEELRKNDSDEEKANEEVLTQEIKEETIISEDKSIIKESCLEEVKDNNMETVTMYSDPIIELEEEPITEEEMPNEIKTGYYAPNGNYLGETKVKVIDVSYYQGDINWDVFVSESDCYGVILRLGYYDTLDKKFERNINELKRLNIPYGIYLFSYATTLNGSNKEALFTNKMIDKYELQPTLGIYYDIESWSTSNGASSNDITKEEYDMIISNYINKVSSYVDNKYKVKVYSGRWYAMNRLGIVAKSYVDWVAEYNSALKYDSSYTMWQYTSKGSVPGIIGNVDISYLY